MCGRVEGDTVRGKWREEYRKGRRKREKKRRGVEWVMKVRMEVEIEDEGEGRGKGS